MLGEAVVHSGMKAATVAARQTPPAHLGRLQRAIAQAVSHARDAVEVTIVDRCGELEVRVAGPAGRLRLSFDSAADHAFVRSAVSRAVNRYGLGRSTARKAHSRGEKG
jgi:hypothetical protein